MPTQQYEMLLLLSPGLSEDDATKTVQEVIELIQKHDGKVTSEHPWGKQRLAYDIQHESTGIYHFLEVEMDGSVISEIDRALSLMQPVMRSTIVKRIAPMNINEEQFVQPEYRKEKEEAAETKRIGPVPASAPVEAPATETPATAPKPTATPEETEHEQVNLEELDKQLDKILEEDVD